MVLPSPTSSAMKRVDARELKRPAQGLKLVDVGSNPGPERCLKELRIGCRHAVPGQRAQVRREEGRIVEFRLRDICPSGVVLHASVELMLPQHRQRLSLGVVVQARQLHQRGLTLRWRRGDVLHEVFALSHEGDFAALRQDLHHPI